MAITVSMINWKGGVGKTSLTLHIAAGLALQHHKKVLLVDLDAQCNLSFLAVGLDGYVDHTYHRSGATLKTVFDSYFDRKEILPQDIILKKRVNSAAGKVFIHVDMILSHQELTLLDMKLAREKRSGKDHREETKFELEKLSVIKNIIDAVSDDYDYVLLDCPPNVNLVTQNAFFASDYYVVPAIPDFLSTVGIALITEYMDRFNKDYSSMWGYGGLSGSYSETKFGGIIFNMVDEYRGGPKEGHRQIIANTASELGATSIFEHYVTDGDGISTAAQANIPVFAVADLPRSQQNAQKQADYLTEVVNEFISRII